MAPEGSQPLHVGLQAGITGELLEGVEDVLEATTRGRIPVEAGDPRLGIEQAQGVLYALRPLTQEPERWA